MEALILLGALVLFDLAALRWGVSSATPLGDDRGQRPAGWRVVE